MRCIGIDVGGTNTDAVLIENGSICCSVKAATSENITDGMIAAIEKLSRQDQTVRTVDGVMVGTTHFINAVVQRRELTKVAAIRIGTPATTSLPPFSDWPTDLADLVRGGIWTLQGGHEYDGRLFMPFDSESARHIAQDIRSRKLPAVAVTSMFSPIDASDEEAMAKILRDEIPDISVTCSHRLGRIGLLERENAALLNAALVDMADGIIRSFRDVVNALGIDAPLFITQNDGTVAEAARAATFPVFSFASGATNSMRGASYLAKLDNAIVADVGGTTTDFGHLRFGFPREANSVIYVGGVRTFFRMPDLLSIGLGGGTIVDPDTLTIGPRSVGYRLTQEALVFGGKQLTLTDIAVAAGLIDLGDRARVSHLAPSLIKAVLKHIETQIRENVDRMKTEAGDVTLIVVGGGGFLIPDKIEGVSKVVRVEHGDCANAVGAAVAQVSGDVDQIFQGASRKEIMAQAEELATQRALAAGADRASLAVVEAEDIPIAYLPGNSMRVRVRVVGQIGLR